MLFRKLVKFSQTQDGIESQIIDFLDANGFPVNEAHKQAVASILQTYPANLDTFEPALLARQLRKMKANELLFYVIKPERKPQPEESTPSGQEAAKGSDGSLVPQTEG